MRLRKNCCYNLTTIGNFSYKTKLKRNHYNSTKKTNFFKRMPIILVTKIAVLSVPDSYNYTINVTSYINDNDKYSTASWSVSITKIKHVFCMNENVPDWQFVYYLQVTGSTKTIWT